MNLEMVQLFLDDNRARFSVETIRSYRIALEQFFSYCDKNYVDVKAMGVREWIVAMQENSLNPEPFT